MKTRCRERVVHAKSARPAPSGAPIDRQQNPAGSAPLEASKTHRATKAGVPSREPLGHATAHCETRTPQMCATATLPAELLRGPCVVQSVLRPPPQRRTPRLMSAGVGLRALLPRPPQKGITSAREHEIARPVVRCRPSMEANRAVHEERPSACFLVAVEISRKNGRNVVV